MEDRPTFDNDGDDDEDGGEDGEIIDFVLLLMLELDVADGRLYILPDGNRNFGMI